MKCGFWLCFLVSGACCGTPDSCPALAASLHAVHLWCIGTGSKCVLLDVAGHAIFLDAVHVDIVNQRAWLATGLARTSVGVHLSPSGQIWFFSCSGDKLQISTETVPSRFCSQQPVGHPNLISDPFHGAATRPWFVMAEATAGAYYSGPLQLIKIDEAPMAMWYLLWSRLVKLQ